MDIMIYNLSYFLILSICSYESYFFYPFQSNSFTIFTIRDKLIIIKVLLYLQNLMLMYTIHFLFIFIFSFHVPSAKKIIRKKNIKSFFLLYKLKVDKFINSCYPYY